MEPSYEFNRLQKFQKLMNRLISDIPNNFNNQPKEETMSIKLGNKAEVAINKATTEAMETGAWGINITRAEIFAETKEQKFSRLATARLNVILKRLRTLTNLANTNDYSYTPEQVQKLVAHLENGVGQVREAFAEDVVEEVKI